MLVDSGDIVDGNGFVDADTSGVKGHMARKVLSKVGLDIATAGNHEVSSVLSDMAIASFLRLRLFSHCSICELTIFPPSSLTFLRPTLP